MSRLGEVAVGEGSVSHPGSQQTLGSGTGPGEVARGQPWGRATCKGAIQVCSSEHCTAVSWIRVCVWAGGVLRYFHPFVQLTSRGSSGGPRTVLGVGSSDEEVTQVHGPGDPEVQV